MSALHEIQARLRRHLERLPRVQCRPEFGNQVFYLSGVQFAALTDRAALMHLPAPVLTDLLRRRLARPFVSTGSMGRHGWVELDLDAIPEEALERLLDTSFAAATNAHRRARPRHPGRARRRNPGIL